MDEIFIVKYAEIFKDDWNKFLVNAKNTHFMFNRNYMDYHKERFLDNSLIVYKKNKIIALFPANLKIEEDKKILVSHGGLTFGGIIEDISVTTQDMIIIFEEIIKWCKKNSIDKIIYKPMPHIYSRFPFEEDLYALYRFGFKLVRRDISSSINLKENFKLSKGKKCGINKAKKNNLTVQRSFHFSEFMNLESIVLNKKYKTKPTHTSYEIENLAKKFEDNIKLFVCEKDGEILAGTIVFENEYVAHTQYIAVSDEGKKVGALDIIISKLIEEYSKSKGYFDFGISTENNGLYLNEGLIRQKEMFFGRGIIYDFYELDIV